jgi:hypothetical protein
VTLLLDGESASKVWPLESDAEVKIAGWWGRLDQLAPEQRVWVWLSLDRNKQPKSVVMIADETSEKDIHGANDAVIEKLVGRALAERRATRNSIGEARL